MATGKLLLPRMHSTSHWVSCGQTRPVTEGRALSASSDCAGHPSGFLHLLGDERVVVLESGEEDVFLRAHVPVKERVADACRCGYVAHSHLTRLVLGEQYGGGLGCRLDDLLSADRNGLVVVRSLRCHIVSVWVGPRLVSRGCGRCFAGVRVVLFRL